MDNEPIISGDYTGLKIREMIYTKMEDFHKEEKEQDMDVLTWETDPDPEGLHPAVIFLHGGGHIHKCDKRQGYVPMFSKILTKMGCVVFAPNYPVFEDKEERAKAGGEMAGCHKTAEAVHRLYEFIRKNAAEFHVNSNKIAVMGGSAGGWTTFYAVADYPEDHYAFAGNFWGTPEIMPDVSDFPPLLSVHGTADQLVAYERELPLQEALEKAGIRHDLVTLEGSGHTPIDRIPEYREILEEYVKTYLL